MNTDSITCPNCKRDAMKVFYSVAGIPVHSVLLMDSRERALSYPKKDLALGFCHCCGFIGNTCFDPGVHEYSPNYEETQGFSNTFNAFSRSLARRIVRDYGLCDKTVLEIGCGKGEFLVQLCESGAGYGIGIDPAYVPGRLTSSALTRTEFIQDFYDERYSHLQADMICCRHTLEHIAPTHEFMRTLRRTIGDRRDTIVFFEVPDVYRVLREAAFWDIYYEHCSYFTAGSLARLFRQTGFELLELGVEYDGQYLIAVAKPASDRESQLLPIEDDLADVATEVRNFPGRYAEVSGRWREKIAAACTAGRKVVLWGGGSKAVAFLTTLGLKHEIECVVDINPFKQGKFLPGSGHEVVAPARLAEVGPDLVIVMNPVYQTEIQKDLLRMGLAPEIAPV